MNTPRRIYDDRQLKAVIGMSKPEFEALLPSFAQAWLVQQKEQTQSRVRKMGGGKKGALPTMADKLFAVLLYVKVYPTFDVLGFLTGRERSRACRGTHFALTVLQRALGREIVLPEKKITSVEEFFEKFPQARDIFMDGAERPVQKPKNQKKRKKLYSGKKKQTTQKTIILTDARKRILVMTSMKSGRRHDKRLADKAGLVAAIPQHVCITADTGFQGIQLIHPNSLIPEKAIKNHPLTPEQKQNNRIISGLRILVEHAIGGIKRMKAASDIYRNRIVGTDDTLMRISAGLWNFHLRQSA